MFGDDRPQMFRNDFEEKVVNQRPRLAAASVGRPLDVNKNLNQKKSDFIVVDNCPVVLINLKCIHLLGRLNKRERNYSFIQESQFNFKIYNLQF